MVVLIVELFVFTKEEVTKALKEMHPSNVPGLMASMHYFTRNIRVLSKLRSWRWCFAF